MVRGRIIAWLGSILVISTSDSVNRTILHDWRELSPSFKPANSGIHHLYKGVSIIHSLRLQRTFSTFLNRSS